MRPPRRRSGRSSAGPRRSTRSTSTGCRGARLRETIDAKLTPYGIEVRAVAFTRVALPAELMASVEARRLAAVQLIEEEQNFALEQRRISDRASLLSQEAEARRSAIEHEAAGEAIRLQRLEERLAASPRAATYDLETSRLRVAQQLAGQLAGGRLGGRRPAPRGPAVAREAAAVPTGDEPVAAAPAPSPAPAPEPAAEAAAPAPERRVGARARARRGA